MWNQINIMSTINEADIENLIVQKQKSINPTQTREGLALFLQTPAYKVRVINIIKS